MLLLCLFSRLRCLNYEHAKRLLTAALLQHKSSSSTHQLRHRLELALGFRRTVHAFSRYRQRYDVRKTYSQYQTAEGSKRLRWAPSNSSLLFRKEVWCILPTFWPVNRENAFFFYPHKTGRERQS